MISAAQIRASISDIVDARTAAHPKVDVALVNAKLAEVEGMLDGEIGSQVDVITRAFVEAELTGGDPKLPANVEVRRSYRCELDMISMRVFIDMLRTKLTQEGGYEDVSVTLRRVPSRGTYVDIYFTVSMQAPKAERKAS